MNNVYVAKLGKAVGLKGHIKIFIESDFPNQFKKDATFTSDKKQLLKVQEFNAKRGVVKFENIDDLDSAKRLTNSQLYTTYEKTREDCNLEDNQYFWFDIIGCEIEENDLILGTIKDIHRYPTSDYLEITTSPELVKKELPQTFLIPYIDMYVLDVDTANKKVYTQDTLPILENS